MTLAHIGNISHATFPPAGLFMAPAESEREENRRVGLALRQQRKKHWGRYGSLARAAEVGGVSQGLLSMIERGEHPLSKVRAETLRGLLEAYGLTAGEFAELTGVSIVVQQEDAAPELSSQFVDVHRLPIYNSAAAGRPFVGDDDILGIAYVADSLYRPTMKVIKVCGDSMAPTIEDGDQVFIDTNQRDPISNKIFAIHLPGDGLILKRAMQIAGHWMLVSDNHKYPPLAPDEGVIVGRAYHHLPQGGGL